MAEVQPPAQASALKVFLFAGEASADVLGAGLMRALALHRTPVSFIGIGGARMTDAGLVATRQLGDFPTIGLVTVLAKLPAILRLLREIVDAIVAAKPDVLVLIDAPDFTHRIAARVRRRMPGIPIVKYVSPSVWVWRPGRARAMRPSIDLILALLPFEPEVHRQLGGPACVYVGHPLLDRLAQLRPSPEEALRRTSDPPLVLVLPGSRPSEIRRLSAAFGDALATVSARHGPLDLVLPTIPSLVPAITDLTSRWSVRPRIVTEEAEKYAAFRSARAALAASGTVTLELALAGIPTVAAYRIPAIEGAIFRAVSRVHPVIKANSVILANLVLGELVIPEYLQGRANGAELAPALAAILGETPERRRQIDAFRRLDDILGAGGVSPSERAARAVLDLVAQRAASG